MDVAEESGRDWSGREVEAVLGLYLELLDAELSGHRVVKAQAYRDLVATEVPTRSVKAVEYKLQNISAVMLDLGLPNGSAASHPRATSRAPSPIPCAPGSWPRSPRPP